MKENKYFNYLNVDEETISVFDSFTKIEPLLNLNMIGTLKQCYQVETSSLLPTFASQSFSGPTSDYSLYDFLKDKWGFDTPYVCSSKFEDYYDSLSI